MNRESEAALTDLPLAATRAVRSWGFTRRLVDPDISVGATLVAARVAADRSFAWLSLKTGVPERYLKAIEAEDLRALPGLVYERHFIQRYARALGLDVAPLVRAWVELRREPTTAPTAQFTPCVRWRDLRVAPFVWRRVMAFLVVVLVAGYLGSRLFAMVKPPTLVLDEPPAGLATSDRTIVVTGLTEMESTITVNGQPVTTGSDGRFRAVVALEPGANTIRIIATKRYGRPTVVERQVFVAVPAPPTAFSAPRLASSARDLQPVPP